MSLIWTKLQKSLGVESYVAGSTPGLQLDQEAIEGLQIVFRATGANAPTLTQLLTSIERIIVAVSGTDYVNISGRSLYHLNEVMLGGEPPYTVVNSNTRHLCLFLPFSLGGSMHSPDTILDLRRTQSGLKQAFVRFQLSFAGGEITAANSDVSVYQHYYTLGQHTRSIAAVRQLRERTFAGAKSQKTTIQLDHGSDFDDLASLVIVGYTSANALITTPLEAVTLTASENGTREIFSFADSVVMNLLPRQFQGRPLAASNYDKSVFFYNFLRDDLKGQNRTLKGLLDGSAFSNLLLEVTPGAAGTYYVLLDRINTQQTEPGAETAGG